LLLACASSNKPGVLAAPLNQLLEKLNSGPESRRFFSSREEIMPEEQPEAEAEPTREDHDHGGGGGGGHNGDGDPTHRDTIAIVNGRPIDLAKGPLTIEFGGFTLRLGLSPDKERSPGETYTETYREKEIRITGPVKGDPRLGHPPGRLFINGKHIDYHYDPASGRIFAHGMFSVHFSLVDFARAYISANPNLLDIGHGPHP
jgi:hypothetical protein